MRWIFSQAQRTSEPSLTLRFFVVNKIRLGQQPPHTLEAEVQGVEALNAGRRQTGCGTKLQVQNGQLVWSSVHTCPWSTRACALHCSCCTLPLTAGDANSADAAECRQLLFLFCLGVWHCGVCVGWRHSGLVCVRRVTHLHVLHTCTA